MVLPKGKTPISVSAGKRDNIARDDKKDRGLRTMFRLPVFRFPFAF
jgi:hypothetical protein